MVSLVMHICDYSCMLSKAIYRYSKQNHLIKLAMVFTLLFASAHIALHDLDVIGSDLDVHNECQVCRLNHMPVAALFTPSLFAPLQLLVHLLPVEDTGYHLSRQFHNLWARAPPLF